MGVLDRWSEREQRKMDGLRELERQERALRRGSCFVIRTADERRLEVEVRALGYPGRTGELLVEAGMDLFPPLLVLALPIVGVSWIAHRFHRRAWVVEVFERRRWHRRRRLRQDRSPDRDAAERRCAEVARSLGAIVGP